MKEYFGSKSEKYNKDLQKMLIAPFDDCSYTEEQGVLFGEKA